MTTLLEKIEEYMEQCKPKYRIWSVEDRQYYTIPEEQALDLIGKGIEIETLDDFGKLEVYHITDDDACGHFFIVIEAKTFSANERNDFFGIPIHPLIRSLYEDSKINKHIIDLGIHGEFSCHKPFVHLIIGFNISLYSEYAKI